MADSWEDWETEEVVVPGLPAAPAAVDPVKSKFAGEDEGEEEEPKWKANVPAPQQASTGRRQSVGVPKIARLIPCSLICSAGQGEERVQQV